MKKLFKFTDPDSSETSIEVFNIEEIEKEFNLFGLFFFNEYYKENIADYKEQRSNELNDFCEYQKLDRKALTYSQIKEFLEEFEDEFEYDDSKNNCRIGRPKKFVEYDDEEFVSYLDGFYDEDHNEIEESDPPDECVYTFVTWWDGSNHQKIYLSGEGLPDTPEDITDDYIESFEEKIFIGSDRNHQNDGGLWTEYFYSPKTKQVWALYVTCWQGERSVWDIIEDKHEIDVIFAMYDENDINEHRPEMRKEYGYDLHILRPDPRELLLEDSFRNTNFFEKMEIFSKNDAELIETTSGRGEDNTIGADYYKLGERIIVLSWSMWQGESNGWYESSEAEMEIALNK